jgi:hypothetical protein
LTGAVPVAAQENVAGTWSGTFTRGTGREDFTMVLKQDGEKVTGTLTGKVATGASKTSANVGKERDVKVEGSYVANKLALKVGKQESIEGTVAGDVLTGQSTTESGAPPRVVSATKAK